MPLPKPPATKAALLTPADFQSQAAPHDDGRRGQRDSDAQRPGSLDLFDGREVRNEHVRYELVRLPAR